MNAIIRNELPPKFKDPDTLIVTCIIGDKKINNALLDLGSIVNLLPYIIYQQFRLGDLKPHNDDPTISQSIHQISQRVLDDVLVQIDTFFFPVDFVVLDTELVRNASSQIPVIFKQPFLSTIDATIKKRSRIITLVF